MMLHDKSIQRTKQSSNKTPEIVSNYKTHKKEEEKRTNLLTIYQDSLRKYRDFKK